MYDHRFARFGLGLAMTFLATVVFSLMDVPTFLVGCIVVIGLYHTVIEFYVGISFLLPGRRKPSFEGEGWTNHFFDHNGCPINTVSNLRTSPSPLMVMVHGWRSSSSSVADRAMWFTDRGWHVVMVELPNHGSSGEYGHWSAYRSMKAVETVVTELATIIDPSHVSSVSYYGHSMGGFIGLRLASNESLRVASHPLDRIILESPMTMYEPILDEIANGYKVPVFLRATYRRRLIERFNESIGQIGRWSRVEEFNIPLWGVPKLPILCIQAVPDERLGMGHYEQLLKVYSQPENEGFLTSIPLESLKHSGARVNEDRNNAIEHWLEHQGSL
ncbi:alpha/beta hydrolase [Candidatus Poseidoniales archaeon]|nr:alpha/beta hydrolase [Euryarchaeota archaeon]MDA8550660.1 alpha/beta hydrolase [Candidatus Poseidoniales archaeon]MDA8555781.1 alpha/beta hydrolase [Candidatus Poseidoniales archaeon]MDB4758210.1 alpha/beta hydrolase [Candidatus Poseidoniaceae archaeon]